MRGGPGLTVCLAAPPHQQLDQAQEAFGCRQVKGSVAHLPTHVGVRPELQEQPSHLGQDGVAQKGEAKKKVLTVFGIMQTPSSTCCRSTCGFVARFLKTPGMLTR